MTTTLLQLHRRRDAFVRMPPLDSDTRVPGPRPTMKPKTALTLCLTGEGYSLSLEELRQAWLIADDGDKPFIEAQAHELQKAVAA